jgi:excisionase family DNA binding protein
VNQRSDRSETDAMLLDGDRLFSVTEAASLLRISPWTVRSWLTQKRIRRTKVGGRTLIRMSELRRVVTDDPVKKPPVSELSLDALSQIRPVTRK